MLLIKNAKIIYSCKRTYLYKKNKSVRRKKIMVVIMEEVLLPTAVAMDKTMITIITTTTINLMNALHSSYNVKLKN